MKNLYKKIALVMGETSGLAKDLAIEFKTTKYSAVSEKAVLNEIKPLLKKHGLVIVPVKIEPNQIGQMTQIVVTWQIVDIDSGEKDLLQSVGNGVDSQDKGSGKAMTYAYKALMQKTFMLFSGEDTDNTSSHELDEKEKEEREKVASLFKDLPMPIQKAVLDRYKIRDINDLPQKYWRTAIEGMTKMKTKQPTQAPD